MTTTESYVFDDEATGGDRHAELADYLGGIFDRFTCRRLTDAGLTTGMRCLEVGAGAGSVALWMAETVGPDGEVIATDSSPKTVGQLPIHAQLRPLQHNIVTDRLDGPFDLIHARAVLVHIEQREAVLEKLAAALNPGGALIIEEFAPNEWRRVVLDGPDHQTAERLLEDYHQTLMRIMVGRGSDPGWGMRVNRCMRWAGLVDVDTELGGAVSWNGGTAGCMLPHTMISQLRMQLEQTISADRLVRLQALLRDPELVILNTPLISTTGRKPSS